MSEAEDLMPEGEFHPQLASARVKRTSKETFLAILEEGVLSKQRRRVYKLLFVAGPLTGREVNERLGSVSGHKRLSELQRLDVVDIYGTRTCGITSRQSEAWDVTGRMPLFREEAVSPHPRKAVFAEASKTSRLSCALRKRPILRPKEKPEDFLGRYLLWLNREVDPILGDIEEESAE